jgi:putative membrane protein
MHLSSVLALSSASAVADKAALDTNALVNTLVQSVVFVVVGLLVFAVAFWLITKLSPFSIRKEIEEDQNTALGIVIGSVIIGLALVIAAAISGG